MNWTSNRATKVGEYAGTLLDELTATCLRQLRAVARHPITHNGKLDSAEISEGIGALRLRLVAVKGGETLAGDLRGEDGKYLPHVLLDLDYWALIPR